MISLYKTDNGIIRELENYEADMWIKMVSPSNEEANFVSQKYGVDLDHIKAALDNDESARYFLSGKSIIAYSYSGSALCSSSACGLHESARARAIT